MATVQPSGRSRRDDPSSDPGGQPTKEVLSGPGPIGRLDWSPDGRWLAIGWGGADNWIFVRPTGKAVGVGDVRRRSTPSDHLPADRRLVLQRAMNPYGGSGDQSCVPHPCSAGAGPSVSNPTASVATASGVPAHHCRARPGHLLTATSSGPRSPAAAACPGSRRRAAAPAARAISSGRRRSPPPSPAFPTRPHRRSRPSPIARTGGRRAAARRRARGSRRHGWRSATSRVVASVRSIAAT